MRILALVLFLAASQPAARTWIDTAEAYFATNAERLEFTRLGSEDERAKFVERYWLRRDPTPGTAKNEFRDAIMDRIARADAKYKIENTRGSETARGFVFVVFGPAARFRSSAADPATSARSDLGEIYTPSGDREAGESYETWIYDRERTPRLLEMVGLPTLTFDFVIRPQKHIDELQSPGLASELREKLAGRSIVTPDAGLPPAASSPATALTRLDAPIPEVVAHSLDEAPPPTFASPFGYFGTSSRWSAQGQPEVVVWFAATPQTKNLGDTTRFIGRIVRGDGSVAGTFSEPLRTSTALRSWGGGTVNAVKLTLPAGDYTGSFAIADNGQIVTDATVPFHVSDATKAFAASSILLSATPEKASGGMFDIGKLGVVPRADQTFSKTESLWYSGEVVNPADPQKVVIDVRLRSGPKALGASQIALESESVGPRRYFYAREMPLASFEPGDYTLYVTVRDAGGAAEIRRADFRIVP